MAIFDNLFGAPPEYLTGLLGAEETDKLRKQALTTGLVNSAIALIAQPRNQRFGSALPYIGRALMAGQQAGQGVYSNALQGLETQQKLAEFKRKQEQQKQLQEMLGGITDPNERLFAQLAPEQFVAGKLKPRERKTATVGNVVVDTETGQPIYTAPQETKAGSGTTLNKLLTERAALAEQNPNDPNLRFYDDAIRKETSKSEGINVTYGAPVAGVDAAGNPIFFQPTKSGGAPAIIPGVAPPPKEEKAPTESQAKSQTFYSQMTSANKELENLQAKGFDPTKITSQVQTAAAGTPLTAIVSPAAQQARQAQEQWAESFLRVKTGAAATQGEVDRNVRTFFPQIGDSKEVIAQKARARKQAEQDVLQMTKPEYAKQIMPKGEQMPKTTRRKFNPATGRIE